VDVFTADIQILGTQFNVMDDIDCEQQPKGRVNEISVLPY
jgi:hypothetical protein